MFFQLLNRHSFAYKSRECDNIIVADPGFYHWRDGGEKHMNDPLTIGNLQVSLLVSLFTSIVLSTVFALTFNTQLWRVMPPPKRVGLYSYTKEFRLPSTNRELFLLQHLCDLYLDNPFIDSIPVGGTVSIFGYLLC